MKWDERACEICEQVKPLKGFRFCPAAFMYNPVCLVCEPEQNARQWREREEARERKQARNRRRNQRFKERHLEKYRAGIERLKEYRHVRRARENATRIGPVSFKLILEIHGHVCHICKQEIPAGCLHFDHVIPLSRGGGHAQDNIKPACARCNIKKGNRII